jgi:hypothetical protein
VRKQCTAHGSAIVSRFSSPDYTVEIDKPDENFYSAPRPSIEFTAEGRMSHATTHQ